MRILSWNVNGLRALAKKNALAWLETESPDILCMQEIRINEDQIPEYLVQPHSTSGIAYHSYWASAERPGYAGVGIYTIPEPIAVQRLGIADFDQEGRFLQADFPDFSVISAYFPHVREERVRLEYKLDFCSAIRNRCDGIRAGSRSVILCGDFNIAHTAIDLARPEDNKDNPGYLPEERAWMDDFLGAGYVDSFRYLHPGEIGRYSWFSYRADARKRNIGWRIDYICVDEPAASSLISAGIRNDRTGSDHDPVEITIDPERLSR
ncbi:exodeoxyribonuclease III [Spirochaetia bacterium]|nr:exodeoxyribonuclease III [Spirochaetia bacterium]GHU34041.1 exodeoxyribonuclease III [Spirochaetia bacterium]